MSSDSKKLLWFFLLVAPLFHEVLSGNTPLLAILHTPAVYLILVLGYGIPAVLIRDYAVRKNLTLVGIFVLGLIYGLYNEGVLVDTLYRLTNVPVPTFDGYGYALGLNFPWGMAILISHAFHSVLFPILLGTYLFPNATREPLLSKRASVFAAILSFVVLPYIMMTRLAPVPRGSLGLVLLFGLVLFLIARKCVGGIQWQASPSSWWRPFLLGAALEFLFSLYIILPKLIPPVVFFAYFAVMLSVMYRRARRMNALTLPMAGAVATGAYTVFAMLMIFAYIVLQPNPANMLVDIGFLVFFLYVALTRKRRWPAVFA